MLFHRNARAARNQDDWKCQSTVRVERGAGLVSREDLHLRSMTASARGTVSHPGSGVKRGLNREIAPARIRTPRPAHRTTLLQVRR